MTSLRCRGGLTFMSTCFQLCMFKGGISKSIFASEWRSSNHWCTLIAFVLCALLRCEFSACTILPSQIVAPDVTRVMSLTVLFFLLGVTAVPCVCLGIFLGGFVLKKMSLTPLGAIKMTMTVNMLSTVTYVMLLFLGCETGPFAGATVPYKNR